VRLSVCTVGVIAGTYYAVASALENLSNLQYISLQRDEKPEFGAAIMLDYFRH
jgi:hypothetical protein